jgi:hypothetical protein
VGDYSGNGLNGLNNQDSSGTFSRGLGGFGNLFSPNVGELPLRATFRSTIFPNEKVEGQGTSLGFSQEDFSLLVPLYQDPCNDWSVSGHFRAEPFHTGGTILPDSLRGFPDNLYAVHLGTEYRHLFDNNWIAGGGVSFGSASDRLFHSINEMTVGVNTFLRIPSGERNAWLFTLSYSPTSELAIPVPGVAYIYQPSDTFRAYIGLPFQLYWRPLDDLTLTFSYMLVRTVHARATYRLSGPFRVYAGFDWSNESYFLAGRADDRDRFFYYDKRLTTGVQYSLSRNLLLDLSAGYTFDRFFFQGHSYNDRHHDRVDVGNGAFVSFGIQSRW